MRILVGGTTKTRFKVSVLLRRSLVFPRDGVVDRRDSVPRGSKPLFETTTYHPPHSVWHVLESCNSSFEAEKFNQSGTPNEDTAPLEAKRASKTNFV